MDTYVCQSTVVEVTVSVYSAMLGPQCYMLCVSYGVCGLVVDAPVVQVVFLPVVVHDKMPTVQTVQTVVEVPQSQFLHGCGRGRDHAATSCLATGRCHRFSSSPESVDISVGGHFSRSVHPDVERQVSLDDEEFFVIEGSGVAGSAVMDKRGRRLPSHAPQPPQPPQPPPKLQTGCSVLCW